MGGAFNPTAVRALVFDVFGTVADWRGTIIREGAAWDRVHGTRIPWEAFADRWRAGYLPAMDKVRRGVLPWMKLDALHRLILDEVLAELDVAGWSERDKDRWNRVWRRLTPWPDVAPGLHRLKSRYVIAPLSNGDLSLLVDMARLHGLPWDAVLSAELFRHFKPDREVYLGAVDLLGCEPVGDHLKT